MKHEDKKAAFILALGKLRPAASKIREERGEEADDSEADQPESGSDKVECVKALRSALKSGSDEELVTAFEDLFECFDDDSDDKSDDTNRY